MARAAGGERPEHERAVRDRLVAGARDAVPTAPATWPADSGDWRCVRHWAHAGLDLAMAARSCGAMLRCHRAAGRGPVNSPQGRSRAAARGLAGAPSRSAGCDLLLTGCLPRGKERPNLSSIASSSSCMSTKAERGTKRTCQNHRVRVPLLRPQPRSRHLPDLQHGLPARRFARWRSQQLRPCPRRRRPQRKPGQEAGLRRSRAPKPEDAPEAEGDEALASIEGEEERRRRRRGRDLPRGGGGGRRRHDRHHQRPAEPEEPHKGSHTLAACATTASTRLGPSRQFQLSFLRWTRGWPLAAEAIRAQL